jgi:hypothetical protein
MTLADNAEISVMIKKHHMSLRTCRHKKLLIKISWQLFVYDAEIDKYAVSEIIVPLNIWLTEVELPPLD